jgi:hypothetical protein
MNSYEKSYQLQNSITSQDLQSLFWSFGQIFIRHGGSNIDRKLQERYVRFVNNVTFTLSY